MRAFKVHFKVQLSKMILLSLLLPCLALFGSCSNVLRDFPDKSSDDYYVSLAQIYLDQFKFDKAINVITPVLANQPKNYQVVKVAMLSYAGRAGLRVLDLILSLTDLSGSTFFRLFSEHFPGANADTISDMKMAVSILEAYESDPAARTSEFNVIGMFLHWGVLGSTLNGYGYNSNNTPAAGFDACDILDLPEVANTDVVQSLSKALEASSNISGNGGITSALDALLSAPELSAFTNSQETVCPGVAANDVQSCDGMRALVNEGSAGIGIGAGVVTPCP